MPLIRRCFRVAGKVQGVGFRETVESLAAKHGLHGEARNDRDRGLVTLVCEGEESAIDLFAEELRRVNPFAVVRGIERVGEDERIKGTSGVFDVVRGSNEEELAHDASAAKWHLMGVYAEVKTLSDGIRGMNTDMNTRFKELDVKYDIIGKAAVSVFEELQRQREDLRQFSSTQTQILERQTQILAEHRETVEKQSEVQERTNQTLSALAEAIKLFVPCHLGLTSSLSHPGSDLDSQVMGMASGAIELPLPERVVGVWLDGADDE